MKKTTTAILFFVLPAIAFAQKSDTGQPAYPQHYFRNPLNIPIFLAGNFGECRPGHFHSGTDIKTLGRENQPVHAAASGYISRIKTEKGGFGHALYITHPDGYTTLYAHLNDFAPAIQHYLRKEQYKQERWDIDIQLSPSQFPVKKGQQIAWSGNTGASTAPHLHFEIRNTHTEHPLNPELFGLPVIDTKPPLPTEIAVYDMNRSIYEQDPRILGLKKEDAVYTTSADTIEVNTGLAGIGLNVNDYMNGSDNTLAFYTAQLYMDGSLQAEIRLDDIGYDVTRYVNAYADYKTHEQRGKWIQCLFRLPGNRLDNIFRDMNPKQGRLAIDDLQPHHILVKVTDDKGNVSTVSFYLKSNGNSGTPLPGPHFFAAGKTNKFENANVSFSLDDKELYDDIDFIFKSMPDTHDYSNRYMVHYPFVPVHHYFELSIRPDKPVPVGLTDKIAMMYSDGKEEEGSAAALSDNDWYKCAVRDFGTYWLAADTVAPVISSHYRQGCNLSGAKEIRFTVKDAMTSVKKFRGEIDGKWVCFEQHRDQFFYKFDAHCPKGRHTLIFSAIDENYNTRTIHLTFTR